MKKLFALLLAVITVFILTTGVSAKTVLKGDLDGNGKITAADARGTLRISAKLDKADDTQMIITDVTGDKKITASDARKILRAAAKLEGALGEIEIGSNDVTETTTDKDKETTTVSGPKTELSSIIGKDAQAIIKDLKGMTKVETTDGTSEYTNGKVTVVSDPSITKDNKLSSITIHDSAYLLNGISVDMTIEKATDTLKNEEWIVTSQNSDEIILSKNLMKIIINVSEGNITSIEYCFAQSLLSPDETTTVPVTETTTTSDTETTTQKTEEEKHEHSYSSEVIAPTCTEKGFTTFTCACGDTYTADETEPTGHDARWVSVIKPAPGVEGLDEYKCRICSTVLNTETLPALPLPETTTEEPTTEEPTTEEPTTEEPTTEEPTTEEPTTEEPTTEEPTTEEPTTEEPTTEHEHNYTVTVVPPSCIEDGYTRFTCSVCSYTYDTDIIATSGHSAFWEIITPAGVGTEGLEQEICKKCNAVLDEKIIPALTEDEIEKPEGEITIDELPSQIKAFISGNFGIEGYNYSGKDKAPISMYVSPDHVKAGMDLSGMQIDMLIRDVHTKKASVYLVRPDVKKYAKLTAIDMATLGIKIDDLSIDFAGGTATPESIIVSSQVISGESYDIYTIYTGTEYCKIYMIGENIKRIETYETASKMLKTRIDVTTFIASPSENEFSVSGLKNAVSYLFLFG